MRVLPAVFLLAAAIFVTSEARRRRWRRDRAFGKSLYKTTDPLVQLDVNNFGSTILNAETAFLVEFYKDWCGHCRNFKPVFLRFANDVKEWDQVVKVAVINCADDKNMPICAANGVRFVPLLKYFPRRTPNYSGALPLEAYRSVDKLRKQLTESILAEYSIRHYADWPKFDYLQPVKVFEDLWLDVSSGIDKLAVVFEASNSSTTGAQLLLDLDKQHSAWLSARRCVRGHLLTQVLNIVDFPSIALFVRNKTTPIYVSELRRLLLADLSQFDPLRPPVDSLLEVYPVTAETTPATTLSPEAERARFYVSESDLLLSIWYALYEEVPATGGDYISGTNLTDLTNFVEILKLYYPRSADVRVKMSELGLRPADQLERSRRARDVFGDLHQYLSSRQSMSTADWQTQFRTAERRHGSPFPKNADWDHCKGSQVEYRGFTCGMWMNFHTLTVHAFLEDGKNLGFQPLKVLRAIQGWVKNFFSCRHCAGHFMKMTTETLKMDDWVYFPSDVVMYLWRAHNTVNNRLHGDVTEDPTFPKRQFPAPFLCSHCKAVSAHNGNQWNTRHVMRYMLDFYTDIRPYSNGTDPSVIPGEGGAEFRTPFLDDE